MPASSSTNIRAGLIIAAPRRSGQLFRAPQLDHSALPKPAAVDSTGRRRLSLDVQAPAAWEAAVCWDDEYAHKPVAIFGEPLFRSALAGTEFDTRAHCGCILVVKQ